MAKSSQNNSPEKTTIYRHRYAILISAFGALSIIMQLYGYVAEVETTKALFEKFNPIYPDASQTFKWVLESSPKFSIIEIVLFGILSGILLFFVISLLNRLFKGKSWDGKQSIADVLIFLLYLGIFILLNNLNDPISLSSPMNFVWGVGFAIVCGMSSHLLLIHDRLANRRSFKTTEFGEEKHKWSFLGQLYQIELSEYQSALSSLIAVTASLVAGLAFTSTLQYTFSLPSEIGFSSQFGSITVFLLAKLLLLAIGLILGVIFQLLFEIHDVRKHIRRIVE